MGSGNAGPAEIAAALGVWPAVLLSGYVAVFRGASSVLKAVPDVTRLAVAAVAGIAIWSIPLLAAIIARVYDPTYFGLLGWAVTAAVLAFVQLPRPAFRRPSPASVALLGGVAVTALLYVAAPSDPSLTHADMMVYSNHAMYIAREGRLDVPYPWLAGQDEIFRDEFVPFPGVYATEPTMTVQFAHLYPAWLAQIYAAFGERGLFRANVPFAVLSGLVFYAVLLLLRVPRTVAVAATLALLLNAAQLWIARTTLTESLTQLLIWTGLLLLLVAVTHRDLHAARWAGGLLGLSALVRIDSFLLVALLLLSAAVVRILAERWSRGAAMLWVHFFGVAVPTFGLGALYYAAFSQPYATDLSGQLTGIAAAGVIAAVALSVSAHTQFRRVWRDVASHPATRAALIATVVSLAVFAYFVRPSLEPFAIFDMPNFHLHGTRSHAEDALVNLAAYLSPPLVWMAIAGWCVSCWALLRRGNAEGLIAIWIVAAGFSALYLWQQSITPTHFWAVRRFVPVVIPGFILFAALFVTWIAAHMNSRLDRRAWTPLAVAATALTATYAVAFAAASNWAIATTREYQGAHYAIGRLASHLPRNTTVLGALTEGGAISWMESLYLGFDRHVVPIRVESEAGRKALIDWIVLRSTLGEPVYLVSETELPLSALDHELLTAMEFEGERVEPTLTPLPTRMEQTRWVLTAYRINPYEPLGVALGASESLMVSDSGFHAEERSPDGTPYRWTDGDASLTIPLLPARTPDRMTISLFSNRPRGTELVITANGQEVFAGHAAAGTWSRELSLAGIEITGDLTVRIISDTYVPAETDDSGDPRTLGVMFEHVILHAPTDGTSHTPHGDGP